MSWVVWCGTHRNWIKTHDSPRSLTRKARKKNEPAKELFCLSPKRLIHSWIQSFANEPSLGNLSGASNLHEKANFALLMNRELFGLLSQPIHHRWGQQKKFHNMLRSSLKAQTLFINYTMRSITQETATQFYQIGVGWLVVQHFLFLVQNNKQQAEARLTLEEEFFQPHTKHAISAQ